MVKTVVEDETKPEVKQENKPHIGNLKLSASKKAINLHIFKPEKFAVIPLPELSNKIGKVYQYVEGLPEIVGEIQLSKNNKKFYDVKAYGRFLHLKETYVKILLEGSDLVLGIYEE